MPRGFQRGGLEQGLAEYVGLKGRYSAQLEDAIRPVIQVADLSSGPYAYDSFPIAGTQNIAALAANYPYLVITPGEGLTLQVQSVRIQSNSGAAMRCWLAPMSRFQVALLITLGVSNGTVAAIGRRWGSFPYEDAVPQRSTYIESIHSTSLDLSTTIDVVDVPALGNATFNLPAPGVIVTDGRAGPDPGGLAVFTSTIGLSIYMSFQGREWPIPG